MKFIEEPASSSFTLREPMTQDSDLIKRENDQPIYKLHGSYNWFAEPHGDRLLVMGGNKTATIGTFRVLARYQKEFQAMLLQPDTHVMVIGYGFGDSHINGALQTAATKGLRIFLCRYVGRSRDRQEEHPSVNARARDRSDASTHAPYYWRLAPTTK
jgi:arginase family enzyme